MVRAKGRLLLVDDDPMLLATWPAILEEHVTVVTAPSVRSAVRRALEVAAERGCKSVALPAIGAGIGGLALQRCAEISLEETRRFLERESSVEEVRFVLFGEPAYRVFEMVDDAARVAAQMARLRSRREER